jgi:phage regulator Rha-like protein
MRIKTLFDELGVILKANKILPNNEFKVKLVEALAELEDNECHRTRSFPKTRLHRVRGVKQAIYRADIDKTSGWRLHVQYIDGILHLKDVIEGRRHDDVLKVIKSTKNRYV